MSLILRRIAVENFRKFRERHEITDLDDGLNVIVEPNETGKSTIMEAVRAALFLRHGSKTQLIQSFQPYGDTVAPQVELDFELDGSPYRLTKRFLTRQVAELEGPSGRHQGEAAEEALQNLFGFEKQSSRFDPAGLGTLGLLWVPQAEGLGLTAPGERVREGIGGALEEQAGAMLGSAAFDRVRERIESQYARFRTPTGRATTAALKEAEARVREASDALLSASQREADLEQAYAELERKRGELRIVRSEVADTGEQNRRKKLLADLDLAKGAAQRLETEKAKHSDTKGRISKLEDLAARHAIAIKRAQGYEVELGESRGEHATLLIRLGEARAEVAKRSATLDDCRKARNKARDALEGAQKREALHRDRSNRARARERHARLLSLEEQRTKVSKDAKGEVPLEVLEDLEGIEAAIGREHATLEAGGVRIRYSGTAALTLDGEALPDGETTLTQETRIGLADGSELWIYPPSNLAGAEARITNFKARRSALLDEWDAASLAQLRSRDRAARDAKVEVEGLEAQIVALTVADSALGLVAGPEALKLFVSELPDHAGSIDEQTVEADPIELASLEAAYKVSETELVRAEEFNTSALDEMREVEKAEGMLALRLGQAKSNLERTRGDIEEIEASPDFVSIGSELAEERVELARRAENLAAAERNTGALDPGKIQQQIDTLDRHATATADRTNELERLIAGLEARIEADGGRGLAERAAAARDEEMAARSALTRMENEANVLGMLRGVLAEAREEVSRSLVGPVAKRAARYTQRILPGCDPVFGADLRMETILRGGTEEDCDLLSQGTQEQLSVLSRLAFAELLREEGRPVSLILDDPLVYSDDYRLDAMIDLLAEAAQNMQVILFTCRERAFRAAPGNRVQLLESEGSRRERG